MANNDPKSLHDRDSSAASDPLASYYSHWIKESNGELKSVGMSLLQLTALLDGSTPPTPVSGTFSVVMTGANTTIASYIGSFTDSYDRHYVSVNDTAAPTAVTDGIAGPASGIVDLGDYNQKTVRMWTGVIDGSAAGITWTQRDPDASGDDGNQGFLIQATANDNPAPATLTITNITPTGFDYALSAAATVDDPDGANILASIVFDTVQSILVNDLSPGDTGTYSGGTPGRVFNSVRAKFVVDDSTGNRVSLSTPQTVTLASAPATYEIVSVAVDPVSSSGATPDLTTITVVVSDLAITNIFTRLDSGVTPPQNDPGWGALSGWTYDGPVTGGYQYHRDDFDLGSYGGHTIGVWGQVGASPQIITTPKFTSATATDTGAGGAQTIGWQTLTTIFNEFGQNDVSVNLERDDSTGDVDVYVTVAPSASLPDDAATDGVHFYGFVGKKFTIPDGDLTLPVTYESLFSVLGHDNGAPNWKAVDLLITSVSGGNSISTTKARATVKHTGSWNPNTGKGGYLPYAEDGEDYDIDLNALPIDLPLTNGVLVNDGTLGVLHHMELDGTGWTHCEIIQGAGDKLHRNMIIRDADWDLVYGINLQGLLQYRNVAFLRSGRTDAAWTTRNSKWASAVYIYNADTNAAVEGLNCWGEQLGIGGMWNLWSVNWHKSKFNYRTQRDDGRVAEKCNQQMAKYNYCAFKGLEIIGDVTYNPDAMPGNTEDHYSFFDSACRASPYERGTITMNFLHGSDWDSNPSVMFGFADSLGIGGSVKNQGYADITDNTNVHGSASGFSLYGGVSVNLSYNRAYCPPTQPHLHENGGGCGGFRSPDTTCGNYKQCTLSFNLFNWWQNFGGTPNRYDGNHPAPGVAQTGYHSDGLVPHHGDCNTNGSYPTGWANPKTNNYVAAWDNGVGESELGGVKAILNNPALPAGILMWGGSPAAIAGLWTLQYDDSIKAFRVKNRGGAFGEDVVFSSTSNPLPQTPRYGFDFSSSNCLFYRVTALDETQWIEFKILDLSLFDLLDGGGNVNWPVKVSTKEKKDLHVYAGIDMDFQYEGDQSTAPTDNVPPTVPANMVLTVVDANTVNVAFDQSTDANSGVGGYEIWARDVTLGGVSTARVDVPDSATPNGDVGSLVEGHVYAFKVRAYDQATPAPNFSNFCNEQNATPAPVSSPYAISDTEFDSPASSWVSGGGGTAMTFPETGWARIANSTAANGYRRNSFHSGVGETRLDLAAQLRNLNNRYIRVVLSKTSGAYNPTAGQSDEAAWDIDTLAGTVDWSKIGRTILDDTDYYIMIWTNTTALGGGFDINFFRPTTYAP